MKANAVHKHSQAHRTQSHTHAHTAPCPRQEDDALRKKRDTATSPDDRQWRAYRRARASRHESLVVPLAIANCVLSLLLPSVMVFRLEVGARGRKRGVRERAAAQEAWEAQRPAAKGLASPALLRRPALGRVLAAEPELWP